MSDPGASTVLTTRPIRFSADGVPDPDDVAAAVRIVVASDVAAIGEPDSGDADVAAMFEIPTMDREASVLHLDGDDVVGVTWIERP